MGICKTRWWWWPSRPLYCPPFRFCWVTSSTSTWAWRKNVEEDKWKKAKKRHTDERLDSEGNPKHVCDVCGLEFCTGKQITVHHIATHREFVCSVCGQAFSAKKSLELHKKNQIRLSCKDCNKSFCNKRLLKMHLENVHGNLLESVRINMNKT